MFDFKFASGGRFAELERTLGEAARARAIYELAIAQPVLDMPEALWKVIRRCFEGGGRPCYAASGRVLVSCHVCCLGVALKAHSTRTCGGARTTGVH
jgi:hypothetical protein